MREIENQIFDTWTQEEQALYLELTERLLSALRKKVAGDYTMNFMPVIQNRRAIP